MKKGLLVLPLLLIFLFSRCNFTEDMKTLQGAFDSLQVVVGTPQFNTSVVLQFFDAKTEALIRDKKISVTISGKNATDVYSNIGIRETVFSTTLGLLPLVIDPKVVDTVAIKTTPIEFDVVISVDGYLTSTQRVAIREARRNNVIIRLLNLSDTPQGVSVVVNPSFAAASSTGQVSTPASQSINGGSQTATIPAGTVLKDVSGNPVTGTVKSQIVFFDASSGAAQNAIPGGTMTNAVLPDGTKNQVMFKSVGTFSVDLTAGDKTVKTMSNGGIKLRTNIAPTQINPKTGQLFKAGDQIDMWSRDKDKGEWIFEKTSTVKSDNGQLYLEETITHLSLWFWAEYDNLCYTGPQFVFKGDVDNYIYVSAQIEGQSYYYTDHYRNANNPYQIYYGPQNKTVTFKFEDANYFSVPGSGLVISPSSITISNLCENKTYEITLTEIPPVDLVTVNFRVSARSNSNAKFVIRPTLTLYNYNYEDFYSHRRRFAVPNSFDIVNGVGSTKFRFGRNYHLEGYLGTTSGRGDLKIDKISDTKVRLTMTPNLYFSDDYQSRTVTLEADLSPDNVVNVDYEAVLPESLMNRLL